MRLNTYKTDPTDDLDNEFHELVSEYGYILLHCYNDNNENKFNRYTHEMRDLWERANILKCKNMCNNILYLLNNFYYTSGNGCEEFDYQSDNESDNESDIY